MNDNVDSWTVGRGELFSLPLGCRYVGPVREQWGLNDFQALDAALMGALCAAHRLDYLPSWLSPIHYPLEVL